MNSIRSGLANKWDTGGSLGSTSYSVKISLGEGYRAHTAYLPLVSP